VLRSALIYKKRAERAADEAERQARTLWGRVDRGRIIDSWKLLVPTLLQSIMAAQAQATAEATPYVDEALRVQGGEHPTLGEVLPLGLVGWASDGRRLDTLLLSPAFTAIEALNRGATVSRSMAFAQAHARMIVSTQVVDAYRVASSIASTTRKVTRYARAITPPSCSRCIILAGSDRSWKTDFKRHPKCRCVSVPVTDDPRSDLITDPKAYFDSLSEADQDRIFTKAGAQAIRDGADMARVVNARRKAAGMSGAAEGQRRRLRRQDVFGTDLFTTAELRVTGAQGQRIVRLMPESIYEIATDHADALRLLKIHGYIY
jgi:hypothetical protein